MKNSYYIDDHTGARFHSEPIVRLIGYTNPHKGGILLPDCCRELTFETRGSFESYMRESLSPPDFKYTTYKQNCS